MSGTKDERQDEHAERDRRGRRITGASTGARRLPRTTGGRRHTITVKVGPVEYEAIQTRADEAGVSKQRLMVEAATAQADESGQPVLTRSERVAMVAEFLRCQRVVSRLGVDVSKLAAREHTTDELPDELTAAASAVEKALASLDAAIDALSPVVRSSARPTRSRAIDPARSPAASSPAMQVATQTPEETADLAELYEPDM